jgi:hypothetical protein
MQFSRKEICSKSLHIFFIIMECGDCCRINA